jgi:hypothetical protein
MKSLVSEAETAGLDTTSIIAALKDQAQALP